MDFYQRWNKLTAFTVTSKNVQCHADSTPLKGHLKPVTCCNLAIDLFVIGRCLSSECQYANTANVHNYKTVLLPRLMGIFLKTVGTTQRDGGITTATLHLTLFTYASDNVSSVTGDWTMVRLTMTLNNLSVPLR